MPIILWPGGAFLEPTDDRRTVVRTQDTGGIGRWHTNIRIIACKSPKHFARGQQIGLEYHRPVIESKIRLACFAVWAMAVVAGIG